MGYHHAGTIQLVEVVADGLLRDIVECRCRLVEEDDVRLRDEGTSDEDALLLSATEATATFCDDGVKPHRHLSDIFFKTSHAQGLPRIVMGGPRSGDGDVVEQVARKQAAALQTTADLPAQRSLIHLRQVIVVVGDTTSQRLFESKHQAHQR